jgi:hypothetical protein
MASKIQNQGKPKSTPVQDNWNEAIKALMQSDAMHDETGTEEPYDEKVMPPKKFIDHKAIAAKQNRVENRRKKFSKKNQKNNRNMRRK